jgi:hypothetical protein
VCLKNGRLDKNSIPLLNFYLNLGGGGEVTHKNFQNIDSSFTRTDIMGEIKVFGMIFYVQKQCGLCWRY